MSFIDWLKEDSKVILFDGGMGTELINRGLEPGKLPDLLNIESPDVVKEILANYYQYADMVQTCTFSANLVNLERQNLANRITEINNQALENIMEVRPNGKLIVGDIGPSGEFRPPVGKATGEQWKNGFQRQVSLLEHGVDLWHVETMSDIKEIQAAIHVIKEISQKPIIASMTYRQTPRGFFTIMGDSLETCVEILEKEDVEAIGTNCTMSSGPMIELTKELVTLTDLPVSIKPNAGQPIMEGGRTSYEQPPDEFMKDILEMVKIGAKIVGGCCGTSPVHIKLLRENINAL